jgi:hypothetical protein
MSYGNEPAREPDTLGASGRAWKVGVPDETPDFQREAECGVWIVHAPHAHSVWWWYAVMVVSLREIPGAPPSRLQFPGASHELLIVALNPEEPLPDVDRWGAAGTPPVRYLTPIDQCVQFIVADDEQAQTLANLVVDVIADGMSPDQDFRGWWQDCVAKTSEHLRLGGHPA